MQCEQARQLFDAYLDGELSSSLETELGAHRVRCAECRRALALLEVSGHIIASDGEAAAVADDFTDRLLACVELPQRSWSRRLQRLGYVGVPLAAAALIGLAFLGTLDGRHARDTRVLGAKVISTEARRTDVPSADSLAPAAAQIGENAQRRSEEWLRELEDKMGVVQQLNLTVLQWMEFLNESKERFGAEGSGLELEDDSPLDELEHRPPDSGSSIEDL